MLNLAMWIKLRLTKKTALVASAVFAFLSIFFFLSFSFLFFPKIVFAGATINKPTNNLGMVGWWTFDGKDVVNGVARDMSGRGNHGNLTNISTSTFYTMGKIGQGFKFDGVDDYVVTNLMPSLTNGTTAAFWVYLPINNASAFGMLGSYSDRYHIGVNSSSQLAVGLGNTNVVTFTSIVLDTKKWYHIVVSANASNYDVFINGVERASNQSYTTGTISYPIYLGARNFQGTAANFTNEILDDVRIYNRALSANEVKQLYGMGGSKLNTSISPAPAAGAGLSSGLVGHWTFDGKDVVNGVARDMSGRGNNGNLVNISTSTFYTMGKIGQGFKFDGVNDYVNIGAPASLNLNNNYTISAWVYSTILPPLISSIVRLSSDASVGNQYNKYRVLIYGTQDIRFGTGDGTASDLDIFTTNLPLNTWLFITCTLDINNVKACYKNGVLISTATNDVDTSLVTPTFGFIGTSRVTAGYFYGGKIDDVRIYNRALSASEVKQLYNQGR